MENTQPFFSTTTTVCLSIIAICFFAAWIWTYRLYNSGTLNKNRRWVESFPSLLSTLGVLGTFLGITLGLLDFNTQDLDKSIPNLLDGLKTAFFTSLAGMLGSMILTRIVNSLFDKDETGASDVESATTLMCNAIKEMDTHNKKALTELKALLETKMNQQIAAVRDETQELIELKTHSERTRSHTKLLEAISKKQEEILQTNKLEATAMESMHDKLNRQADLLTIATEHVKHAKGSLNAIDHRLGEIQDAQSAQVGIDEEINQKVGNLGQKLHEEVLEIEQSMDNTNRLLKKKFDEFAELLKKSNTEALVEVMKKVTEEFQNQMNALISKLVKENFDQLNKSVERMNKWQQENKEMIKELTAQYRDMAQQFGQTGQTLHKVGDDTKRLVSDGGKLEQLIKSLNAVLIEDKKFVEITKKLESTVELTKNNMQTFDESTSKLNEWVRKQRNFVDGVNNLIAKLEELNKLRNYSDEFWKETKKGMNEGIGIIKEGSRQLQSQISELDTTFYERLSTTLSELDACIQAMIEGKKH